MIRVHRLVPTGTCSFSTVLQRLQQGVKEQRLVEDRQQVRLAKHLDRLQQTMANYNKSSLVDYYQAKVQYQQLLRERAQKRRETPKNLLQGEASLSSNNEASDPSLYNLQKSHAEFDDDLLPPEPPQVRVPRGLYIYSPAVGTGKSMLMDLLFTTTIDVPKKRYHFHEFLSMIHQRVHRLNQQDLQTNGRNFAVDTFDTPIERVALELAHEMTLLCLDEFQVTDVCDSVILPQLFETLFAAGVVLVTTSNRPPELLYENGINREYFLPFVDMLKRYCIVHELASEKDYRTRHPPSTWFDEADAQTQSHIDELIRDIVPHGSMTDDFIVKELDVDFGRTVSVRCDPTGTIGHFHFDELCNMDRGASDFRALAQHLEYVVLEDIPVLTLKDDNRARRFITLVDELYEYRTKLIATSRVIDPSYAFINTRLEIDDSVDLTDEQWIDQAESLGHAVGALASVHELGFAFRRAASRLKEMTSKDYWDRVDALRDQGSS